MIQRGGLMVITSPAQASRPPQRGRGPASHHGQALSEEMGKIVNLIDSKDLQSGQWIVDCDGNSREREREVNPRPRSAEGDSMGGRGAEGANRAPGVHAAQDDASLGLAGRTQRPVNDNAGRTIRSVHGVEQLLESLGSSTKAGASGDATAQSLQDGARPVTIPALGHKHRKTSLGHQSSQSKAVSLAQRE